MKKIIIALTLAFCFTNADAQSWLTIRGGGGIALQPGAKNANMGMSMLGGVGLKKQFQKRLYLASEVQMDIRAVPQYYWLNSGTVNQKKITKNYGASYITLPLTLQYAVPSPFKKRKLVPYRMKESKSYFFIEGGGYGAYGLGGSVYIDPALVLAYAEQERPLTAKEQKRKAFDAGVTLGMGVNISFKESKNRLAFGTRANYGFMDIYNSSRVGSATNLAAVGYLKYDINLSKKQHIRYRW